MNSLLVAFGGWQSIVDAPLWGVLLLKISTILSVAWLAHLSLLRANPRWRVFLWRATALGLVGLPVVVWLLPVVEIRIHRPPAGEEAIGVSASAPRFPAPVRRAEVDRGDFRAPTAKEASVEDKGEVAQAENVPLPNALTLALSQRERGLLAWAAFSEKTLLLTVWLTGIAILASRLFVGHCRIRRMIRRAGPLPDGVWVLFARVAAAIGCRGRVELLQSADVSSPFLSGLRRPVLLLPARMCDVSYSRDLPAILAHELTHVRSHDLLWNFGLQLISIVLWFHPLAWRVRRTHLAACELVCDAASASFVGDVADYCRTLARVAVEVCAALPAAGIAMARTSAVGRRLRALKTRGFHLPLRRRSTIGFAVAALTAVAILGTLRLAPAAPRAEESIAAADPAPGSGPHDPKPVKADPGTTLDSILKRLADEEKRYDMLEVTATVSYRHLNLREPLVNNSAEGDKFVTCMSSKTGDRSVFAGDRLYHEEKRENKMADGTTSSTLLRQAYDAQWTRQDRQFTSSNPELKVDRWTTIGLDQKDELRLLRPHTILFHDDRINGQLLSAFLHSGWFDERNRYAMTVEYVGDERIDGLHCHKLKCALPSRGKVNGFFFVWLARDRNLLAVRHEWHKPAFSLIRPTGVSYVEQFREIRPGVWFPFLATHLAYRKHGVGSDDPRLLQWRRDTIVEKVTPAHQVDSKLFSVIEVPKDTLVNVLDRDGRRIGEFRQSQSGNIEIAADRLLAMRQEARTSEEDKYDPKDATASDRKARIDAALRVLRSDPPPSQKDRIEAALEILRNYRAFQTNTAKWATAIRELIMIGKPAVPKLIEELDRTDHLADRGQLLRALGFVLRGIGDPRAVPALIRSLPFTLQPSYSDLGCSVADQELQGFMEAHDRDRNDHANHFSFGRPINEVLSALQKLCGIEAVVPREQYVQEFKDIHHIFLSGKSESDRPRQELFLRFAETWADWWAQNWRFYVKDESEAQVEQTRNALKQFTKPETVAMQLQVVDVAGKPIPGASVEAQRSEGGARLVAPSLAFYAPVRVIGATGMPLDGPERTLHVERLDFAHRSGDRLWVVDIADKNRIPGARIKIVGRSDKSTLTAERLWLEAGGPIQVEGLTGLNTTPAVESAHGDGKRPAEPAGKGRQGRREGD
jgi:beta-lactamase regulating signal transducer with metallopeptidase domain